MHGVRNAPRVIDLFDSLARGDIASAFGEFRDQYDTGADPIVVLSDLAEFVNFVTAETTDSESVPDVIGAWILRNLKLQPDEHSAPHVIGLMLMNTFGPWWDQ